jgi:methylamine dehydrogenase accessory protein MauD
MLEALVVSQVLLWVLVLSMAVMMLALLRQVGVLHERIAPMGALTLDRGPKEGEAAPLFEVKDLRRGTPMRIGGARGRSMLLFFLSPTCPVCKKLLPIVKSIQQTENSWLDVVLTSDGEAVEHERFIRVQHLEDFPYVLSADVGMTYRIGKLPYGVMIDDAGVIRAKGLLNTREHLESLIEAKQMGVPSIQQFLQSRQSEGHEPHDHEHEHDQAHDGTHDHAHEHAHDHTDDHALNHDVQPLAAAGKLGRK